ncbi:Stk1 family PASTA domain-containing Ser/Thr kinase [Actinomyces sp. MRS3W]|uniref:Stk1 family PASTA domain-containing Ser/Thr kinase n=1 Tax=Actinomyces sp. MRS3W TaxID=2800796 RepID=UPI0028FD7F3F|nr:Stk1 family PASTA domain-containing Ser/Thr kinase [Actinomyces sp. MRS3W]MDU0349191.1 Stk1 family PASTA domain-containing Ser/Thr kinase [Actinomyces sp. MRS3W]
MTKDPLIGRLVDSRYEIVDRVARGGMATIYRARDRRLDRLVALKLMHPHLADSPDFVARFRREARAAARLSNPGVVAVYDQGSLDGIAYLVMELVEGPNLRDLIASGPLTVREALGLTAQILGPLGAAHRAGLVHRDVKPENVLLPADGSVAKVADFGLARAVTEVTQTTTGNVLGTVAYLAPELITSGASAPCADVYSVGVILYELLTGKQPFTAESPIQIAFRNVHEDVPAPSLRLPDLPERVDALVADMTRRDPERRLRDADAALSQLREVVAGLSDAELSVKRGGATGSVRTQEVLAANAEAARSAMLSTDEADGDSDADAPADAVTPDAGLRTVSLPIGSIAPDEAAGRRDGTTRALDRNEAMRAARAQDTRKVSRHAARRPRRRALIAAVLVAAAGGASTWYFTAGPGRTVPVPQIVGMSAADAQVQVEAAGLVWGTPTRAYSDTVPADAVISCEPGADTRLHVGEAVTPVISRGIERKTVPDVVGATEEDATAAITEAGLSLGAVTKTYSDSVAAGMVISSDPEAGQSVNHSSAVAIVVSLGRQPATIPDVTGMNVEDATTTLEAAGLTLGTQSEAYSDDVASGLIISSSPASGAEGYYRGDSVDVTVSKGPEMVDVPDVSGMSEAEATAALESAGLEVEVSRVMGGLFGTAHSTDPAAGTSVRKGSKVTLNVV